MTHMEGIPIDIDPLVSPTNPDQTRNGLFSFPAPAPFHPPEDSKFIFQINPLLSHFNILFQSPLSHLSCFFQSWLPPMARMQMSVNSPVQAAAAEMVVGTPIYIVLSHARATRSRVPSYPEISLVSLAVACGRPRRGAYQMLHEFRRQCIRHCVEIDGEFAGFSQVIHY